MRLIAHTAVIWQYAALVIVIQGERIAQRQTAAGGAICQRTDIFHEVIFSGIIAWGQFEVV